MRVYLLTAILGSIVASAAAAQSTDTVLYDFTGGQDGNQPYGRLISDAHGALYGTTSSGGGSNAGTVFKLTPPKNTGQPWAETTLYSFTGGTDGGTPYGALLQGPGGVLFGTASAGGKCLAISGCGVVFELSPTGAQWKETVLYSFASAPDGATPFGDLVMDSAGALYGTTTFGGVKDNGTVFKLTPPQAGSGEWKETVLYRFGGKPDGGNPEVAVTFAMSGVLYGTTKYGGASGQGAVFQLLPPLLPSTAWTESIIHSFPTGGEGGTSPSSAILINSQGRLFGETFTYLGGAFAGTIFMLESPKTSGASWKERIIYDFAPDGVIPNGGAVGPSGGLTLGKSGVLYGTTQYDYAPNGAGITFSLAPPPPKQSKWTLTPLHGFTVGTDGQSPNGVILAKSGVLYGTTSGGGACPASPSGCGTVFSIP